MPHLEARLTLGTRIRRAREAAGLSGPELAARLKWSNGKGRVSRFENDKEPNPTLETLQRFADVLEMPLAYFLGELTPEEDRRVEDARVTLTVKQQTAKRGDPATVKRFLLARVREIR